MRAHPQAMPRTGRALVPALLFVLGLLVVLVASPAEATTRTVTLTANGPIPVSLTLAPGDRVRFVNGDSSAQHRVTSQGSWRYDSGPLAPGAASPLTPALTAAGTYRYTDTQTLVVTLKTFPGQLVVRAAAPSPSPSLPPSSSGPPPPASPSASPAGPAPSASAVLPTPSGTPTGFPTTAPSATSSASPVPSAASPSPTLADIPYGGPQALVQRSPHRYGLPALLGVVGIGGVASLLLRFLLSMAPAGRRTGEG